MFTRRKKKKRVGLFDTRLVALLEQLEAQAITLDQKAQDADEPDEVTEAYRDVASQLRAVLVTYLEPGMGVRYWYAGVWRSGMLAVKPAGGGCCQISRNGPGGWIDQVGLDPRLVRVLIEEETGDE